LTVALFAAGSLLGPSLALAQSTPPPPANTPTTNPPSPDTVGPRELQNFNLNGTVTRPAETPPAATARAPARRPSAAPVANSNAAPISPSRRPTAQPLATVRNNLAPISAGRSPSLDLPVTTAPKSPTVPLAEPSPTADTALAPPASGHLLLWPWLLLAGVLGGAAAFFLWRRNSREALADGQPVDSYVAPDPTPAPRPASIPTPKPAAPVGIVSTRLRAWIEIAFAPLGCIVEDEQITIEFEVQLRNSGSALARDILVEASMFNAGPTQDQDIGRFFAEPVGQGERIAALPPLQSVTIRSTLVAPRANIQLFELAGRQVFVPLIAFNVLYRLSSGLGQTSVGYMLGRESTTEKLGPLRVDLGPRAFTKLGIRALPIGVRK
jgi:hypothetical protein